MESRVWANAQDKFVDFLVFRGEEIHTFRVRGLMLKRKAQGIAEQIEQGAHPAEAGAKPTSTAIHAIHQVDVSPSNKSLTFYAPDGTKLKFTSSNADADAILATILERGGRTFIPAQQPIGVVEAVIPPTILGVIGGLFWLALQDTVQKHAAGEEVEVKGRRQGMQKLLVWVADTLGSNGVMLVGVGLGILVVVWLLSRLLKRPERTVWVPATS